MHVRYTFEEVALRATKSGKCSKCGLRRTRTEVFMQTLNPFNRTADGTPKSREQIWEEIRVERLAFLEAPLVCRGCSESR